MQNSYVHGYNAKEGTRLQDQASTLVELLHSDTLYPAGNRVLEVGCGVGAQTITLAGNSLGALITSSYTFFKALGKAVDIDWCQVPGCRFQIGIGVDFLDSNNDPMLILPPHYTNHYSVVFPSNSASLASASALVERTIPSL